jgi:hypothetical protein
MSVNWKTNDIELWKDCQLNRLNVSLFNLAVGADHLIQNPRSSWWIGLQRIPEVMRSEKIFVIGAEGLLDWQCQDLPDNVYFWDSKISHGSDRGYPYLYWFDWAREVAADRGDIYRLTDPRTSTPGNLACCMLGKSRWYRDMIADFVEKSALRGRLIYSYFGRDRQWITGSDIDLAGTTLSRSPETTMAEYQTQQVDTKNITTSEFMIRYQDNKSCLLSMLLPWRIYNDSWFTIISETEAEREYFTEKTAKPLLGKRLFVLFGAAGMLGSLRDQGFQTFGSVIDESYDDISDTQKRFAAAWQQVEYLAHSNISDVYDKILPVLEHNQRLMLEISWKDRMIQQIHDLARQHDQATFRLRNLSAA